MKNQKRQWFKQFGTGLLILIMGIMLVNKTVYTHVHILPDGSLVYHAHPFSTSDQSKRNTSHHHSSLELCLLDILEIVILSAIAEYMLRPFTSNFVFREAKPYWLLPVLLPVTPGRAPPAFV